MKSMILVLGLLFGAGAMAQTAPAIKKFEEYSSVVCRMEDKTGEQLATFSEKLILVRMDDHVGLFKQMRIQVGIDQVQLQILLEEDFAKSAPHAINVLVNFAVNQNEISQEFAGQNITYASIKHLNYKAYCEIH